MDGQRREEEKEQEGARDGKKALNRGEGRTDRILERREKPARQKGLHNQDWICPLLPTLAWGQGKVGTLKSVAFSDAQFRLVEGRKETKCVSASLGSVASCSQQCGWLDPSPSSPLTQGQGGFSPKLIKTKMRSIPLKTKETE